VDAAKQTITLAPSLLADWRTLESRTQAGNTGRFLPTRSAEEIVLDVVAPAQDSGNPFQPELSLRAEVQSGVKQEAVRHWLRQTAAISI
jgi:hypothetical protein